MLKVLVQLGVVVARVCAQALKKSILEEIEASQAAARNRASSRSGETRNKIMSLSEAKMILNVKELNNEEIEKNWKQLHDANVKCGSTYLKCKVNAAKDRLINEIK